MIKYVQRGLMTVGIALSIVVVGFVGVGAQSNSSTNGVANGFRISPVRSELAIEKGKNQTITVTVENPTNVATTAQAIVNDFVASDDESGTPRLILDNNTAVPKNDFRSLVADIPSVQLGAQQKKDITVNISVPQNANSGGYYGAIRFVPSDTDTKISNVGLTASVGTIVLVTVPGNLTERVDLVQLSAAQKGSAKSLITSGSVDVLTRLKNTGDIHVQPFGKVQIKNMFGKVVSNYEFNNVEPRANILPDSTRKFNDSLNVKKLFGRYTIEINLGYSQGSGNLILSKASFWYLPVWFLYTLLVIVIALATGGYFLVRKLRRKTVGRKK